MRPTRIRLRSRAAPRNNPPVAEFSLQKPPWIERIRGGLKFLGDRPSIERPRRNNRIIIVAFIALLTPMNCASPDNLARPSLSSADSKNAVILDCGAEGGGMGYCRLSVPIDFDRMSPCQHVYQDWSWRLRLRHWGSTDVAYGHHGGRSHPEGLNRWDHHHRGRQLDGVSHGAGLQVTSGGVILCFSPFLCRRRAL